MNAAAPPSTWASSSAVNGTPEIAKSICFVEEILAGQKRPVLHVVEVDVRARGRELVLPGHERRGDAPRPFPLQRDELLGRGRRSRPGSGVATTIVTAPAITAAPRVRAARSRLDPHARRPATAETRVVTATNIVHRAREEYPHRDSARRSRLAKSARPRARVGPTRHRPTSPTSPERGGLRCRRRAGLLPPGPVVVGTLPLPTLAVPSGFECSPASDRTRSVAVTRSAGPAPVDAVRGRLADDRRVRGTADEDDRRRRRGRRGAPATGHSAADGAPGICTIASIAMSTSTLDSRA